MKQVSKSLFYIFLLIASTCQGSDAMNPNGRDTSKVSKLTEPKSDVTLTLPARIYRNGICRWSWKSEAYYHFAFRIYLCETGQQ